MAWPLSVTTLDAHTEIRIDTLRVKRPAPPQADGRAQVHKTDYDADTARERYIAAVIPT